MQQNIFRIKQETDDATINIALDTISIGKQAIIFANTKRSAEKTAEDISKKTKGNEIHKFISEKILKALTRPTKQCQRLARCIENGVAFHHSGLTHAQRDIIEENFRARNIKIIAATPTLAAGLDLPAFRTVLKDLKRFGFRGLNYIPVLEYEQMAGRAGRPKFDKYGESIIVAKTEEVKEELLEMYIYGENENIYSKLAVEPVLRTYLLSLIVTNFAKTKKELIDFFSQSFYAYQYKDIKKIEYIIEKMLKLLKDWGFIESEKKYDFMPADDLNQENSRLKATRMGKRVAELYLDPLTANALIKSLKLSEKIKTIPFSFLQIMCSTLEMRPMLRATTKDFEIIEEELIKYEDHLLEKEHSLYFGEYEAFIDSVKTALFFQDWIYENDEEFLLEKYKIRPGEINYKLNIADWLVYCLGEFSKILNLRDVFKELINLRIRLKNGVKEELLPLVKIKGVGRVRARKLFKNGLKDIKAIKSTDFVTLAQILGSVEIAKKIKIELGQENEVNEVKKGTRKGQLSIKKFDK